MTNTERKYNFEGVTNRDGEVMPWLKYISYIVLFNVLLALILTMQKASSNQKYSEELSHFGILMILFSGIIVLINLAISALPCIIGGVRYHWTNEKQSEVFFQTFLIASVSIVGGSFLLIFFVLFPNYSLLATNDPVYGIWWYSSFSLNIIVLFLLYVYKVYKEGYKNIE